MKAIKRFSLRLNRPQALALGLFFGLAITILAWTDPTASPPANNAPAPINVSSTTQTKAGGLNIATTSGNVGIGTASPTEKLEVAGEFGTRGRSDWYMGNADTTTGLRWVFRTNTDAETGSNAGSNLEFISRTDAGAFLNTVMKLQRTGNVGIGKTPTTTLDVNGAATATLFSGSGASLTSLNASNLSSGTVPTAQLGSGTASSSTFLRGDSTWAVPPSGFPARGTTLPSCSVAADNGTEYDYVVDATRGIIWHLKCNTAEITYKWEFVGGPPLSNEVTTEESTTSTTYTNLATVGPSVTLPRAGDYLVTVSARGIITTGATGCACISYSIGTTAASPADEERFDGDGGSNPLRANITRTHLKTGLSVVTLQMKYKTDSISGTYSFANRYLAVIPIRVN